MDGKKNVTSLRQKPSRGLKEAVVLTVTGKCALSSVCMADACQRMLKKAGIKRGALSIVFLSDKKMRALNCKALGHDYVTDVVTFDFFISAHPKSDIDGEIYICPAVAKQNALLYGESFQREVLRYVAHGILHLLGYDDATETQRNVMRKKEDQLLIG